MFLLRYNQDLESAWLLERRVPTTPVVGRYCCVREPGFDADAP
jgi:hypothetical protein